MKNPKLTCQFAFYPLLQSIAIVLCFFVFSPVTLSASPVVPLEQSTEEQELTRDRDPFEALERSFREALAVEEEKLVYLTSRVEAAEAHTIDLSAAYTRHQVMISNQANMLAAVDSDIQSLSREHIRQGIELTHIEARLTSFSESIKEYETVKKATEEQIRFYNRQLENTKAQPPNIPVNLHLIDLLDSLIGTLETKREKLDWLIDFNTHWLQRYLSLEEEVKWLTARYERAIYQLERERIMKQRLNPLQRMVSGELSDDIRDFSGEIREMLSTRFWYKPEDVSWETYAVFLVTFLTFFLVFQALLFLLAKRLGVIKTRMLEQNYFYRYLILQLVQRSLLIMGTILFFHFYPVRPVYQLTPFFILFPVFIQVLLLLLGIQWWLVFLRGMRRYVGDRLFLRLLPLLRILLVSIFFYGTIYFLISRIYCADCILLTSWRLLGQLAFVLWMAYFLRVFYINSFSSKLAQFRWFEYTRQLAVAAGIVVVFTGLLADLTGYGGMAVLWYAGLWRTTLLLLWAYILFGFLTESDVSMYIEKSEDLSEDEFEEQPYPVRWLIVRVARLALVGILFFSLPLAWGADRSFLADVFYVINFRVSIGDFEFNTMGVIYTALVFLIIYTISVLWKSVLRNRLLSESDMEEGLKDSITRISVYGLWMVGILISMRVMGISGTSFAVVFGALGIGLGFGLQNIFKDFVSGIILLFERPIQVGDIVEVDGIWGTVKEINVRATYVKSFDNADLIIPNSDFISQQVTNWSFRDPRIRRRIQVRVAYGSDIKLVKDTLMNIAYKHPRVLRRPYPEVYFMDLGESAMLFELRVFLHVDYFIIVETEIRDDISNQFKELGIRIAFPQQDIYIKERPSSSGPRTLTPVSPDLSEDAFSSDGKTR